MIMVINPESEVIEPEGQRNVKIRTNGIDEAALCHYDGPVKTGRIIDGRIEWSDGKTEQWNPQAEEDISEEEYRRRYKLSFVVRKHTPSL